MKIALGGKSINLAPAGMTFSRPSNDGLRMMLLDFYVELIAVDMVMVEL